LKMSLIFNGLSTLPSQAYKTAENITNIKHNIVFLKFTIAPPKFSYNHPLYALGGK
jgi:hypothetical protein